MGSYTVEIAYTGFAGEGNENYTGSGSVLSTVEVYRRSSGGGGGYSGSSSYVVTFEPENGEKATVRRVTRNTAVTEPEPPVREGYTFAGWYADLTDAEPYDFSKKVTKSFTLYAKWTAEETNVSPENAVCDGTEAMHCPSLSYDDLNTKCWYHLGVDYVLNQGWMHGYGDRLFGPNDSLSRAMLVTILYRREGSPETDSVSTFADVPRDSYYSEAVSWAQESGLILGYSETEFAPEDDITREQMAAVLYRYARFKGEDTSLGEDADLPAYADTEEISEYALPAMRYAVASGLMLGRTETTLNPLDSITRAETATLLWRWFEKGK